MNEIDSMDMLGYIKIRAWSAKRKAEKKAEKQKPKRKFIDEVWPAMKP